MMQIFHGLVTSERAREVYVPSVALPAQPFGSTSGASQSIITAGADHGFPSFAELPDAAGWSVPEFPQAATVPSTSTEADARSNLLGRVLRFIERPLCQRGGKLDEEVSVTWRSRNNPRAKRARSRYAAVVRFGK
ncbi:hypothetical protein GCM10009835_04000 [Planosporangium flavigriseum]|uniref:Uncharacterized protein n=1 Tax=Planosporangium flavigriseum TaxID=373681 RepID=A0A8J3LHR8_9ACTN|nr:hypothetical protein Pfl04_19420 [Planosporangium flavigriseum]